MSTALAIAASLPWVLLPPAVLLRASRSRRLDDESPAAPEPPPLVSVVLPARNEARNIERCLRSILSTTYPAVEVIVVDDHSSDGTGDLARATAAGDPRVRVLANDDLPPGWFGKQWACATGARAARGEILCFTDADTTNAPDLLTRAVSAMRARSADLLSVAGSQEMHGFWERILQPQVFWILQMRYGSTEAVGRARRAEDVIANGQFIMMRREAYDAVGGHASVRDKVAEDLALAQGLFRAGRRVALVAGTRQLSTRMYASLGELVRGWGKNVYAGGRDAMPGGSVGRALFPIALLLPALFGLAPVVALVLGLAGMLSASWLTWSAIAVGASLLWWILTYAIIGVPVVYALAYPLGQLLFLYVALGAIARGRRVAWKGREYVAR